jgi:hypothetical protein
LRTAGAPDDLSSFAQQLVAEQVDILVTATAVAIALGISIPADLLIQATMVIR